MPATYEPISTQTLGTATADIFFTSIPQTYTDLVLIVTGTSASVFNIAFRVNSDSGSNYSYTELRGDGSAAASSRTTSNTYGRFQSIGRIDTTGMHVTVANFMNYSNTTTYKTVLNRSNNAGGTVPGVQVTTNLWRSTSAITAINVLSESGANFAVGSTFTLYGIKAA
jgi:hypothetical protein